MSKQAETKGQATNLSQWVWMALIPLVLVVIQWFTDNVRPGNLLMEVPLVRQFLFLESTWAYAYLHLFTFIPVFLLSFDSKVHYYRQWKYLLPSILIVGTFFIVWDVFFTIKGVWAFNESYFLNISFLHLPIEEWLFFIIVPFACLFIYECLNAYIKKDLLAPYERIITILLIITFLTTGLLYWGHLYTTTTFLLSGSFLLFHLLFSWGEYRARFYLAFLVSLVPFLIVNGVLTGGYTQQPIVIYNPEEYLGIRITSIPLDDMVYGFLLLLGVVTLYEFFKKQG